MQFKREKPAGQLSFLICWNPVTLCCDQWHACYNHSVQLVCLALLENWIPFQQWSFQLHLGGVRMVMTFTRMRKVCPRGFSFYYLIIWLATWSTVPVTPFSCTIYTFWQFTGETIVGHMYQFAVILAYQKQLDSESRWTEIWALPPFPVELGYA